RQQGILDIYLNRSNGLAGMPSSTPVAKIIGTKLGCSSRTVQREWKTLKEKFFSKEKFFRHDPRSCGPSIRLIAQKTKGSRRIRYYLGKELQLGKFVATERLHLPNGRDIRQLRRRLPIYTQEKKPPRQSRMNRLFGALMMELGTDLRSTRPDSWPPEEFT